MTSGSNDANGENYQMVPLGQNQTTLGGDGAPKPKPIDKASLYKKVPPTLFSNEDGNLKFVAMVVKHPCKVLVLIFGICIVITALLFGALKESPITDDTHAYDLSDIRSIKYDSLLLTRDVVFNTDKINTNPARGGRRDDGAVVNETRPLEERGDITYWIYEAKTEDGVFSRDSLEKMKLVEDTIFENEIFQSTHCLKTYEGAQDKDGTCERPLSALNMYYASVWDWDEVEDIMDDLDNPFPGTDVPGSKVLDDLSICVIYGIFCDIPYMDAMTRSQAMAFTLNMILGDELFGGSNPGRIPNITKYWDGSGELPVSDDKLTEITRFAAYLKDLTMTKPLVDFFFDQGFSKGNLKSMYSRSITTWGGPLHNSTIEEAVERGDLRTDDDDYKEYLDGDQKEVDRTVRKAFIMEHLYDEMEAMAAPEHNAVLRTYYFMIALIFDVFLKILINDMMMAIISISVVFLYMKLMIGSYFLATVGMLEIVFSLPLAWYTFVDILGFKYFSSLNPMCLFIVAAIGADDIFVFMDSYKLSQFKGAVVNRDVTSRLSWVYRRSGSAMFITSATTCSAFCVSVISPIANVQSFGMFAALVIAFDYVLVMTMFCTATCIYHNRYEKHSCRFCCCWPGTVSKNGNSQANPGFVSSGGACEGCCASRMDVDVTTTAVGRDAAIANYGKGNGLEDTPEEFKAEVETKVSQFYDKTFSKFILKAQNRVAILLVCTIWFVFAAYYTSQLVPTTKTEQLLDSEHPLQKSITILNSEFPTAARDRGAVVTFTWGIDDLDRSDVNQLRNTTYFGEARFVQDWTFNPKCQEHVMSFCDDFLKNHDQAHIKSNDRGTSSIICFVDELKDVALGGNRTAMPQYPNKCERADVNWTWPVAEGDLDGAIASFLTMESCVVDDNNQTSKMRDEYADYIGYDADDGTLKFVTISVDSSVMDPWSRLSEDKTRVEYEYFQGLVEKMDETAKEDCGPVMMTDLNQKFIFMNTQKIYRTSAVQGALIGVGIAFVVLFLCTQNVLIAGFASLSILFVLISVIGTVTMIGWELNTIVAILITILAGFSVDYVVHLAYAFKTAHGSNEVRIREAFGEMGVSVLSGMMTSVLASLPLFLCSVVFFASFGTFLCCTIAFSWVFANFFFMSLLATFDTKRFQLWGNAGDDEHVNGGKVDPDNNTVEI